MRLYHPTFTDRNGETRHAAKWYCDFTDHHGVRRRMPAFADKGRSETMGRNIDRLVSYAGNGEPLNAALTRWVEALPDDLRAKLADFDLLSRTAVAGARGLLAHVESFIADLTARGRTADHIRLTGDRIKAVLASAKADRLDDLSPARVRQAISDLMEAKGLGLASANHYARAIKSFCLWMQKERFATVNVLAGLSAWNARVDRRHTRRAFSEEELTKLFAAAEAGPVRYQMDGPTRRMLYLLAAESGLRANELRSLTPASFDLSDLDHSTVTVRAAYSKHRREDRLPIRRETAEAMAVFLWRKPPDGRLFPLRDQSYMIGYDLAAAGIIDTDADGNPDNRDEAGNALDFHTLRHTHITRLARSGVPLLTVKALARHSSVTMTERYAHSLAGDERSALEALPALGVKAEAADTLQATGTDDVRADGSRLASSFAKVPANDSSFMQPGANNRGRNSKRRKEAQVREFAEEQANGGGLRGASVSVNHGCGVGRGIRSASDVKPCQTSTSENASPCLDASFAKGGQNEAVLPDDLAVVVRVWPDLSAPIKAGIMAMVRAAASGRGGKSKRKK